MGSLLFHFTRKPKEDWVTIEKPFGGKHSMQASAGAVLQKILEEGRLLGSDTWTADPCICFTEAPIHEFNAIFSLVAIAASEKERPRYEPYGVAVKKRWLFEQGGRPVIYDHPDSLGDLSAEHRYRGVPYDPLSGLDFTWEREWRLRVDELRLDPKETLVVVPTADEAFSIAYDLAEMEADQDRDDPTPVGVYHVPKWLAAQVLLKDPPLSDLAIDGVHVPHVRPTALHRFDPDWLSRTYPHEHRRLGIRLLSQRPASTHHILTGQEAL